MTIIIRLTEKQLAIYKSVFQMIYVPVQMGMIF